MRPILYSFFILFTCLQACVTAPKFFAPPNPSAKISLVNPFIGTGGHGHTYPGATMPFGMMQLSPDTRLDGWDGCSGYHYSDSIIYGFTHTHLSGTGVSDYGDILLMPTSKLEFNNGADGNPGYRSKFSHEQEHASPGYYGVHLEDYDIDVELTVSPRAGIHRYQFAAGKKQLVILDLEHRDEVLDAGLTMDSKTEISGHRHSKAWATNQKLFFNLAFSRPYSSFKLLNNKTQGKSVKAAFEFDATESDELYIRIGISAVDVAGAKQNRLVELGNKSFETIRKEAETVWEKQLNKIDIKHADRDQSINFYTAMYHAMLAPNLYQDTDGRYRGMDLKIHQTKAFDYYTVFSLWDTYRATHPLFTLIEQDRTNDFINTFIAKHEEGGILPIWDLSANYTGCMIGYHSIPVIVDAYQKGIRSYDVERAFEAMKHAADQEHLGLKYYKNQGFIPVEKESESVSKTLEYAYDDWCIAVLAKELGRENDYARYLKRAQFYKNIYDPSTQFMRGRFRNTWFKPFDPYEVNFNYTEANAWQYSNYVPQDITGYIKLLGGKDVLETKLDEVFTAETATSGRNQVDITGLIGQYAHGNEPSHHMAYLYNYIQRPHKTQERVHQILTELYTNTPDGISGNEDCGQMSAWYIFSAMGFYPVTPGDNHYVIGTPLLDEATIHLENGKQFHIIAPKKTTADKYIKAVYLNSKAYDKNYIRHEDIMAGGSLRFEMTDQLSSWGSSPEACISSSITEHLIVPVPFIAKGEVAFKEQTSVQLESVDEQSTIHYRIDDAPYQVYTSPFTIDKAVKLTTYATRNGMKSAEIQTHFFKINPKLNISLATEYANQYNAGGNNALIDGILGTEDFRTGTWQGYQNVDLDATIDLGESSDVQTIKVQFLQDQKSWIFLPTEIEFSGSVDGQNFETIEKIRLDAATRDDEIRIKQVQYKGESQAFQYIRVRAKTLGELPSWHLGHKHQGTSWIFVDEIIIE